MDLDFKLDRPYVFIGMFASGKSMYGSIVADTFQVPFDDIDLRFDEILKKNNLRNREDLLEKQGSDFYLSLENEILVNTTIDSAPQIISPPGSIAYHRYHTGSSAGLSEKCPRINVVDVWKEHATFVYLRITLEELLSRKPNVKNRGVVSPSPRVQNLAGTPKFISNLYWQRVPLYEDMQDITIDLTRKKFNPDETTDLIVQGIRKYQHENSL